MKLVIEVDDEEGAPEALAEVLRLLEEGYTSGYQPRWFISEGGVDPVESATA